MPSTVQRLAEKRLISPPNFVCSNTQYEVIMGSVAYGCSSDTSDMDVYGFCIPPKEMLFPHLAGEIEGFGRQKKRFDQYQEHHIMDQDALGGKGREYDLSIYNIARYFSLCMENNPNLIDSLFVPVNCVLHSTMVGNLVRENRKMFLHKGSWHKFKGYAYSQLHKMGTTKENTQGKRRELREQHGFDIKFAYHVVRLLYEVEMILTEGDLDLQRHREHLKAIRRGDVSEQEIRDWASAKEKQLEQVYVDSKLQHSPDEDKIKRLLLQCLEEHYGNLDACVVVEDVATKAFREIAEIVQKYSSASN